MENGQFFEKGSIIPDNDFPETQTVFNKSGALRKGFEIVKKFSTSDDLFSQSETNKNITEYEVDMKVEKQSINDLPKMPSYGKWKIKGSFAIIKKTKYQNEYIHCYKKTEMFNKIFGTFFLEENKTYRFHFKKYT